MSKDTDRKKRTVPREGRPANGAKPEDKKMRTPVQIVCPPELKKDFSEKCDAEGINASEFIRDTCIVPFVNGTGAVVNLLTFRLMQVANVLVSDPAKAAAVIKILEGK